jgi:hypothetical protein
MLSKAYPAGVGYGRCVGRSHRDQLAELLADLRAEGSFATRRTAPTADLGIDVRGVGPIGLPVSAAQAKEFELVARPAKYRRGTDAVLERRISAGSDNTRCRPRAFATRARV